MAHQVEGIIFAAPELKQNVKLANLSYRSLPADHLLKCQSN
jgi:hypothetical protein